MVEPLPQTNADSVCLDGGSNFASPRRRLALKKPAHETTTRTRRTLLRDARAQLAFHS